MILTPLIIYYSKTGTTAKIAEIILPTIKAESRRLNEPKDWRDMLRIRRYIRKQDDVKELDLNTVEFNPIILLTPVWEGLPTMAMIEFVEKIDLKGKSVILGLVGENVADPEALEKLRQKAEERGCRFIETVHLMGVLPGHDLVDLDEEELRREAAELVEKVFAVSAFTR